MGPSSIFSYVNLSGSVRFTGWAVLSDAKHTNFRSLYHVNSSIFLAWTTSVVYFPFLQGLCYIAYVLCSWTPCTYSHTRVPPSPLLLPPKKVTVQ